MKKAFERLSRLCFWIVLLAVPIFIFDITYRDDRKTTFPGCCATGVRGAVEKLVLDLPLGFVIAPSILLPRSLILDGIIVPPSLMNPIIFR
jgi:hypothetical protein